MIKLTIEKLIHELKEIQNNVSTIPGVKTLQPWASWIFYDKKDIEVRTYPNKMFGLTAIVASSWDRYFDKKEVKEKLSYPYEHFCIVGFVRLVNIIHFKDYNTFKEYQDRHLNPLEFYDRECFGWEFRERIPIKPIYYKHSKNKDKETIELQGTMARVRIVISDIINKIESVGE